jgi:Flp pilus assembly secretin CpaC
MRCHIALALVTAMVCPSWAYGDEPGQPVAPALHELHGPQLPTLAEESREVVRLASAVEPLTVGGDVEKLKRKLAELDRLQAEVDKLRVVTKTPAQVLVHVEVLEVSLTKLRKLGIELPAGPGGIIAAPEAIAKLRRPAVYTHTSEPKAAPIAEDHTSAEFVALLKRENIGKVLADPSLVALSGRPASFLVGGQIPIPVPAAGGQSTVEYRDFGTQVDVSATTLGNDRVRMEIKPSVSELDDTHAIEVHGVRIPALRVRQCNAGYEAAFDETVVLGGAVQERIESIKTSDGRVEERPHEFATWFVVRAERAEALDPSETQVR